MHDLMVTAEFSFCAIVWTGRNSCSQCIKKKVAFTKVMEHSVTFNPCYCNPYSYLFQVLWFSLWCLEAGMTKFSCLTTSFKRSLYCDLKGNCHWNWKRETFFLEHFLEGLGTVLIFTHWRAVGKYTLWPLFCLDFRALLGSGDCA